MVGTALARLCPPLLQTFADCQAARRDGSRRAGIIRVHPVHSLGRERQQKFQHAVADPGAGGAELALAVAVATGQRHDLLGTGTALGLEILESLSKLSPVLHVPAEPHGVFERQRSALAGMRTG